MANDKKIGAEIMYKTKPCPFCGNEVLVREMMGGVTGIDCQGCGAIASFRGNESPLKAILAWNKRKMAENEQVKQI